MKTRTLHVRECKHISENAYFRELVVVYRDEDNTDISRVVTKKVMRAIGLIALIWKFFVNLIHYLYEYRYGAE